MKDKKLTVLWCLNEACSLYGEECYESSCTRCHQPATRLTWMVVLCEPRGIYGGLVEQPRGTMPPALTAYCVRSCVWYKGQGSHALAVDGPNAQARITGANPETVLNNPKSLHAMTSKALSAWEDEPWSKT